MSVPLADLPDTARIWIYGVDRSLNDDERDALTNDLSSFVDQWTAHGAMLRASVEMIENRFAVVAVDEASAPASGCSIDAMVRRLAELEGRLGCSLLDGTLVFYRTEEGEIEACDRGAFGTRHLTGATPVFDPTIATLGRLRAGEFELPLARSWHQRLVNGARGTS